MPIIDTHAHVSPEVYKEAVRESGSWFGLDANAGELGRGGFAQPLDVRLAEMDEQGVEMQLLTSNVGFYQYDNDLDVALEIHRQVNAELASMVAQHPDRFSALAIVAMQDPPSAIAQMERAMNDDFKGVIMDDHVGPKTYDEPEFLPFFQAAEELGALLFFHQGRDVIVAERIDRYKLPNAVGNLTERTLAFGALVFGGVMDRFPDLKVLLAHAGGYTAYGIARMDKVAGALEGTDGLAPPFPEDEGFAQTLPPSDYLPRFHYDCCTYSGSVLRFLIDTVGIDQVVLGTDYPAPMFLMDPVNWVRGLPELTSAEQEAILVNNPTSLLGL